MATELDAFFNGLNNPQGKPDEITTPPAAKEGEGAAQAQTIPEKGKDGEGDGEGEGNEPRKNRRHRRLEEQLRRERESNIALNERIKFYAQQSNTAPAADTDARLLQIFGDSDEGKLLAKNFGKVLSEKTAEAKELALKEFREEQQRIAAEQKQFESMIDSELENLEDEYDVDLTSDAPAARKARREFLELVQNLSPKDENGTITAYADFETTFEIYQKTKTQEKPNATVTRAKEIASKTMQSSSSTTPEAAQPTKGFRGWMKDYGLN